MFRNSVAAAVSVTLMSFFAVQSTFADDLAPPLSFEPVLHGDATIYGWAPMFMGNASLRYGAWGVFGDVVWADLGQGKTSASGFASAESSLSGLVGTAALTYALVDTPDGHLDALVGARLWSVDAGVQAERARWRMGRQGEEGYQLG